MLTFYGTSHGSLYLGISKRRKFLREILEKLAAGKINVDQAEKALRINVIEQVADVAKLDISREVRRGVPEIILAEGKSRDDLVSICTRMIERNGRAIVSRLDESQFSLIAEKFQGRYDRDQFKHARSIVIREKNYRVLKTGGRVGIVTAGTVDLAVAEEAAMIAAQMGCDAFVEVDAGVAGIHRIVEPLKTMIEKDVDCLIIVAGREGALPTVIAGLVDIPLIAVPASSGYGYGGQGEAALMAMLQACSLGLAVVNIDSGIAAGVVAAQIANRVARARHPTAG
jgi:NCAIR mutase (PurE)-related protein